jgi:predicted enzyme related to lactoylglutathione lyase
MNEYETGAVLFTTNLKSLANFYERVMGMNVTKTEDDHIRLELGSFRLTVHAIPKRYAKNVSIKTPPDVREKSATKLAFRVKNIAAAREVAAQVGGMVYLPDKEWKYEGSTICDGYDPDGNVFQLWQ